tara:strand:+ start:92 stop:1153 length:1062 start_codon:yes stop_codon:yes gene_type:complete
MIKFKKLLAVSEHGYTESVLGIETLGGILTAIVESGTKIPHSTSQVFSTAEDNQPIVSVRILQGPLRKKSYNSDLLAKDCELMGEFELSKINPAPRGVPQIEVFFDIKENGYVHVRAVDKSTGKSQHITLDEGKIISNDNTENDGTSSGSVGTGFFVDDKGHVITNYHVVKISRNKTKILYDHEEIETKLIAYDEVLDLALLKAKIKNKHYVKFSNKSPQKAQSILVAGYPYGKMISDDLKITSGIINSLKGFQNNTSMLQIDATINPGNSGGPIVDKSNGTLVGVATMKLSKDFTKKVFGEESENTNYGIKASQVKDFLEANDVKYNQSNNKFKIKELESSTVFVFSKSRKN